MSENKSKLWRKTLSLWCTEGKVQHKHSRRHEIWSRTSVLATVFAPPVSELWQVSISVTFPPLRSWNLTSVGEISAEKRGQKQRVFRQLEKYGKVAVKCVLKTRRDVRGCHTSNLVLLQRLPFTSPNQELLHQTASTFLVCNTSNESNFILTVIKNFKLILKLPESLF